MKLRLIALPILALGGFALTGVAVARFNTPPRTGPAPVAPSPIPFADRVAGVGIVEPSSETILVGTQVGGVVAKVFVKEGERVAAGAPLVELDARDAEARIAAARAAVAAAMARVEAAKSRVAQLKARPRAEDIAEAAALVAARRALLGDARGRLERLLKVSDRATAANEQPTLEFNVAVAEAQLAEAEARLVRAKAGTYPEDLAVAESDVRAAEADAATAREDAALAAVARDLLVVRAPIDGTVLKLEARPGEYRAAGPNASALLRLGDIATLHVRTDIDELDAWRLDTAGKAVATVRGGSRLQVRLRFVRLVPDVQPKRTLTGENAERIDTRVVQVIYALESPPAFLQPGMLVDVAVEARKASDAGATAARGTP
ncbi:MAG: HlyD family efflux transporter periplasmic adaptor subunit [Planctomycetota bacterium]